MVYVVSGLPRSGTSLVMQMLVAGGLTPLTDGARAPDANNPGGYFEWEKIKTLPRDPGCIAEAEGRVVKVISPLLLSLPEGFSYKVIFMERPLAEVVASQGAMIDKLGAKGAGLAPEAMARALEAHVNQVKAALRLRPRIALCWMAHHHVLANPQDAAETLQNFVGVPLDLAAMIAQVDPSLYRQRQSAGAGGTELR